MTSTASLPHPTEQADQQAEDAQHYRRLLHEVMDMGISLARAVHRQGTAQAEVEDPDSDPASTSVHGAVVAFDRIARCIRRTVALARKVAEPVPVQPAAGQKRAQARRRILREVEDVIQREAGGADVEALEAELRERLDGPELDDEIDDRPTAEVIADICHDLGLLTFLGNHPWKRRGPADVAALCARAAQPAGAVRAAPGPGATWAGPPPFSQEASIELMHQLLEHAPPLPPDGGAGLPALALGRRPLRLSSA